MAYSSIGGAPVISIGAANIQGVPVLLPFTTNTLNAALRATEYIGNLYWVDRGSHTVDTTGSSSIGWMAGALTFANGGTTVKVGIASPDTGNGPVGRAANSAGTITFNVSKSLTGGGGGISASVWNEHVPDTGTMTIAHGDMVCVCIQMTARGGVSDSVATQYVNTISTTNSSGGIPFVVNETATPAYSNTNALPNCVVTASDGTLGFIFGSYVATVANASQSWNNASAKTEYGNFFQFPMPVTVIGFTGMFGSSSTGDHDVILYTDPLGTPALQLTYSADANVTGNSAGVWRVQLFASSYNVPANTPFAIIVKPTTSTNLSMSYKTYNTSAHQASDALGTNAYAINRSSGAFAAQNSNMDRFALGPLILAFQDGVGTYPTSYGHA